MCQAAGSELREYIVTNHVRGFVCYSFEESLECLEALEQAGYRWQSGNRLVEHYITEGYWQKGRERLGESEKHICFHWNGVAAGRVLYNHTMDDRDSGVIPWVVFSDTQCCFEWEVSPLEALF